jgi:hypothetical protein
MIKGKVENKKVFKNISKGDTLLYFLRIQSVLQPKKEIRLTENEIQAFVSIITAKLELKKQNKHFTFSTKGRRIVADILQKRISKPINNLNLNNYIKVLKQKGVLIKDEFADYDIHPQFQKILDNLEHELEIVVKFEINDN